MHTDRTFVHSTCTHSRRPLKIKSVVCNHLDKEAVEGRRSPPAPSCNGSSSLSTSCSCSPGVPSSPGNVGRVVMLLLSTDPRFLSPGRPTLPVTWQTHVSCHVNCASSHANYACWPVAGLFFQVFSTLSEPNCGLIIMSFLCPSFLFLMQIWNKTNNYFSACVLTLAQWARLSEDRDRQSLS